MPQSPAISVIMPVYNAGRYLRSAMDSILAQSFADFEYICIDDGSTMLLARPDVNGSLDFGVARLNADGSLDTSSFGTNGRVTIDFGNSNDAASGVVVQADGRIVVAGTSQGQAGTGTTSRWPD